MHTARPPPRSRSPGSSHDPITAPIASATVGALAGELLDATALTLTAEERQRLDMASAWS
jgi:hypothetical protein